jgi:hypothetical protein
VRTPRGLLGARDPEGRERLAALARMIGDSRALLEREQQILASYTDSLAALIAEETESGASDPEPWDAGPTAVVLEGNRHSDRVRAALPGWRG